jgi:hypothetical protein
VRKRGLEVVDPKETWFGEGQPSTVRSNGCQGLRVEMDAGGGSERSRAFPGESRAQTIGTAPPYDQDVH